MKKMPGEEACPERRYWLALHFLSILIKGNAQIAYIVISGRV
jgi:hypothetical protein